MEENKTINDLIIEELDFDKYKHKKEIINSLKSKDVYIDEREFRKRLQINNKMFSEGKVDFYIAHSCKGYKKTFNWEEIKKSIRDNRKRAITMLIECDRAEKQFQRRNNMRLELEEK